MSKVEKLEKKLYDFINMFGLEEQIPLAQNNGDGKQYLFLRAAYDDENENYPKMITRDIGYIEAERSKDGTIKEEYLYSVQVTINEMNHI